RALMPRPSFFGLGLRPPPRSPLVPYTTLFRSPAPAARVAGVDHLPRFQRAEDQRPDSDVGCHLARLEPARRFVAGDLHLVRDLLDDRTAVDARDGFDELVQFFGLEPTAPLNLGDRERGSAELARVQVHAPEELQELSGRELVERRAELQRSFFARFQVEPEPRNERARLFQLARRDAIERALEGLGLARGFEEVSAHAHGRAGDRGADERGRRADAALQPIEGSAGVQAPATPAAAPRELVQRALVG